MNVIDAATIFFTNMNAAFGVSNLTSILVALIGIFAYRFHVEINRQKFYFENFMKFSKAFNRAIYLLTHGKESSHFIIHQEFPKHFSAMLNFVHILEGERRDRFNTKWTEYEKKYEKMKEDADYWDFDSEGEDEPLRAGCLKNTVYPDKTTALDRDKPNKEEMKQLIYELLKIAKH